MLKKDDLVLVKDLISKEGPIVYCISTYEYSTNYYRVAQKFKTNSYYLVGFYYEEDLIPIRSKIAKKIYD